MATSELSLKLRNQRGEIKSANKTSACSAEHSAHSNNATSPAVRLTMLRIPSYACTSVTVAADFDESADCKPLTVTVVDL